MLPPVPPNDAHDESSAAEANADVKSDLELDPFDPRPDGVPAAFGGVTTCKELGDDVAGRGEAEEDAE